MEVMTEWNRVLREENFLSVEFENFAMVEKQAGDTALTD